MQNDLRNSTPFRRHTILNTCVAMLGSTLLASSALAAPATTQPGPSATQPARMTGEPGPGGRMGRMDQGEPGPLRERFRERLSNRLGQEMDEQTWTEVVQFLKENAPLRFKYFESLPETNIKQRIRQALINRYLMVQNLSDLPQDQKLHDLIIKRIQIDDQCWDLARQYRESATADQKADLRMKITAMLTEWASNQIEERRIRIERLRQILDEESARLEKDQANMDQFVSQNVDRVINEENFLLMAAPPRQMDGPRNGPKAGDRPMQPDMMGEPGVPPDGPAPRMPFGRPPEDANPSRPSGPSTQPAEH